MNIKYDKEKLALNHYDNNIDYFDNSKLLNASMSKETFNSLLKMLNVDLTNKNILDAGAGTGETSLYILNNWNINNITAIDYSIKRLDRLKNKIKKDDKIDIYNVDINYFADDEKYNNYDIIFLFEIIEHLTNPEIILSKLKNKLSKNGKIIGTVPLQQKANNIHLSAFSTIDNIKNRLKVEVLNKLKMRFNNQVVIYYTK